MAVGTEGGMRKAIVTIVHGEDYLGRWRAYALPTWESYADRHGYSGIIAITAPLDASSRAQSRSIAWQKLLVAGHPEVREHDAAVWLDADIVINHQLAPCIVAAQSTDRIGLCEETQLPDHPLFSQMVGNIRSNLIEGCARLGIPHPLDPFKRYGLTDLPSKYFNTGVMVFRPREHGALFEAVYHGYEDRGPGRLYEQVPFSYEVARHGLYETLDPKFNVLYGKFYVAMGGHHAKRVVLDGRAAILAAILSNVYFLHFAGIQYAMRDVDLLDFRSSPIRLRRDKASARARLELESPG